MRNYIVLCIAMLLLATLSCSKENDNIDKYMFGYTDLYSRTTFLPSEFADELSLEDKVWFSSHVFDLQWRILLEGNILDKSQKENAKNRLISMFKTLNYTINTKEFARALSVLDGGNYFVNSSKVSNTPNTIAVLLALRGLNSRHFNTGELKIILVDGEKSLGSTDGTAVLDATTDVVFGNLIFGEGSWDFWSNKGINAASIRLGIDYLAYQTVSNSNDFYSCSNENSYDGVFSYKEFCKALLQTIFDWDEVDNSLLDAVANTINDVTCNRIYQKGMNDGANPPFKNINFDALKFLGYNHHNK